MFTYIYIFIYIYIYIHIYIYTCIYINPTLFYGTYYLDVSSCTWLLLACPFFLTGHRGDNDEDHPPMYIYQIYKYIYINMYICIYIDVYLYMHINVYIFIHVCTCIYTHSLYVYVPPTTRLSCPFSLQQHPGDKLHRN
jgi:hypothetical protein